MSILSICDSAEVLSVIKIVKIIIDIIKIVVPIILIVAGMVRFLLAIKSDDADAVKKAGQMFAKNAMAAVIVFLVPTLVNVLIKISTPNSEYKNCFNAATGENINNLYNERLNSLIAKAEESNSYNDYYAAFIEYSKLSNENRSKYTSRMDALYKTIQTELDESNKKEATKKPGSSYGGTDSDQTESSGTYAVEYRDGVFYLPNTRVKSDDEMPRMSGIYGVHPEFSRRMESFLADASAAGYNITVTSGYRAFSHQLSLWNQSQYSCPERLNWVACPGGSRHNYGIAIDLSFNGQSCSQSNWNCNSAAKWAHENASKYNLNFRMSWEPWHIEPDKIEGGHFGACAYC